jgi:hypothetical protein
LTTIAGLPAHALLVHAIVVLAPLVALLEILCGFWPAARRRLVWLVLALAAVTTVLTPITTEAGEWLLKSGGEPRPILLEHAERTLHAPFQVVDIVSCRCHLAILSDRSLGRSFGLLVDQPNFRSTRRQRPESRRSLIRNDGRMALSAQDSLDRSRLAD